MKKLLLASLLTGAFFAPGAHGALNKFKVYNGNVAISTDGFGSQSVSGIISASVPDGATVKAAYLYTASYLKNAAVVLTLNDTPVTYGDGIIYHNEIIVMNTSNSGALGTSRADVTYIVKPIIDVGAGGIYNFNVNEPFSINFTNPLNPNEIIFFAEMTLGISFSCCDQKSTVMVNDQLLTNNAGGGDDAIDDNSVHTHGNLVTIGSFDDPLSLAMALA